MNLIIQKTLIKMKTYLSVNRSFVLPFTILLLTGVFLSTCKKDDQWGEFANMQSDVWAPQSFTVADVSISEKTLVWVYTITNIEGFRLDRKVGNGDWETGYRTFPKEVRLWNDVDIRPDQSLTYYYRLCAYAGKYQSAYDECSINIVFPAPEMVTLEQISDKKCKITWVDMSTGEEGFKIDHKVGNADWETGYGIVGGNMTSFTDTNMFMKVDIKYHVYAYYGDYNSKKIEVNTAGELAAPTNLQVANNTVTSLKLTWSDNSNNETGFMIEKKYEGGNWEPLATLTKNVYIDENIELNALIYYRVSAFIGNYNTPWIEKSYNSNVPPPQNLQTVHQAITEVTILWQYNYSDGDGFKIERRYEGGNWEQLTTTTEQSYQDNNFEINTQIVYRVCAFLGSYNSSWIEIDFDATFPPPENFVITANSITSVTLTWDYNLTGHDGFKIDRKLNEGTWVEEFAVLTATSYSFTDSDVDLFDNNYTYRIYTYMNTIESTKPELSINKIDIGTIIFGGIVFYLDGNGGGLVCAESDQSTYTNWGCYETTIGGTGTGIGTGAANTAAIVAECSEPGIAARICNGMVLNGYNDWFLPSKDELDLMYENLKLNGIGGFASAYYWSSSEYSSSTAWLQHFGSGFQYGNSKSFTYYVRAVRAF